MAQNKAALIRATLTKVLRLGAGQSVAAEDSAVVEGWIAPVLDSLRQGRIVTIANVEAIPDWAFADLVGLLAEKVAPDFGRPEVAEATKGAIDNLTYLARRDRTASSPFVRRVLDQMEAYDAGSAVVDAEHAESVIRDNLRTLAQLNVIYIADIDELEDSDGHPAVDPLAKYIAASMAQPQLLDVMALMRRDLRALSARPALNRPLKIDFM